MPIDERYLVFDIGGTSLRGATYDRATRRIDQYITIETPGSSFAQDGARALPRVIDAMKQVASRLDAHPRVVGIGFAGPVDRDGQLHAAPTIWGDQDRPLPLKALAQTLWPEAAIEVVNDVTAAGYFFVSETTRDFVVVTVGSGIGGKLFLDGAPVLGTNSRGGEIGHWRVAAGNEAPLCDCGEPGHLGAIASGRGVLRAAIRHAQENQEAFRRSALAETCDAVADRLTNEMLVAAFHNNDGWTRDIIRTCTAALGHALAGIHLTTGIEAFKIVGGFAGALGEEYRRILAECASAAMWQNGFRWLDGIEVGKPDDQPGLNGAGRLLQRRYG